MNKTFFLAGFFSFVSIAAISWFIPLQANQTNFEPDWSQCVRVFDGGRTGNGQNQIRFYNGCPERLYLNVCVLSTDGEKKLYKSGNRIMTNGNYTISTFPFVTPSKVQWTAGSFQAPVPDICS